MGKDTETEFKECTEDFKQIMFGAEEHYSLWVGMLNEEITYQLENNYNGLSTYIYSKEDIEYYCAFIMERE